MDNERKTKDGSETEKTVPPTEYEHNSSLRVDLLDTFPDLDNNIWFFNYRVSSTEIKPGAFIFFVFFRRTSPASHCSSEGPQQIRMAQLSLPKPQPIKLISIKCIAEQMTSTNKTTNDPAASRPTRTLLRAKVSMATFFDSLDKCFVI